MPNQRERQLMIENFQDSLRLVRHLMEFGVEEFAEAVGVTRQTVNNLETKKSKMSATQYIAIAALVDNYFARNDRMLSALKVILDSDGRNYGTEYETAFRDDSLLKRWFEDFLNREEIAETFDDETLSDLAAEYKIFLDAKSLTADDAADFIANLTTALKDVEEKVIVPLRSIEELAAEDSEQVKRLLSKIHADSVLDIRGEETDPDFRNTILNVFPRFLENYNLCLITPDKKLVAEVLRLNEPDGDSEIVAGFVEGGTVKFYDAETLDDTDENEPIPPEKPADDSENKFDGWEVL